MNDTILQATLEVLIQVLLPVVLGAVIVLVKGMLGEIKARVDKDQLAVVESLVRTFIRAAEQNGLIGMLEKEGAAKKEWVLDQIELALAARGIKLDLDELDALIEGIYHSEIGEIKAWKAEEGRDTVEPAGGAG